MSSAPAELQARLQAATQNFQGVQVKLSDIVAARQKLDAQLAENGLVKKVVTSSHGCATHVNGAT